MTPEQRRGFGKGRCMIYYGTVKRQLTQQEIDGNLEQLMLRAKRLGAQDMPITLRKDLTRPLTPREMDTNFQSLDLAVKKARYGDGPYPAAEYIFDGATVLPAGITFSRSGTATYIKNGRLLTAGVDEPVFERGGLRLEPQATNYTINSEGEFYDQLINVDVNYLEDGLAEVYNYTAEEQASVIRRAIIAPHDLRAFVVDGGVATFALDMKPVDAESATIATHINGSRAVSFLFEDPSQHLYGRNEGHPPLFNFNYTYLPDGFIRVSVSGQYIAEDEFTYYFKDRKSVV